MRFQQEVTVMGMKASKGEYEGTKYDSTKVFVEIALDDSKGNAKGFGCQEYSFGTADEYAKYSHLPFPFRAVVDLELTTTGRAQKIVMHGCKPVARAAEK